jgi:transcriptional regulator of acetoin/glycerol metabolism
MNVDTSETTVNGPLGASDRDPTDVHLVCVWPDRPTSRLSLADGEEIVFGRSRSAGAHVAVDDPSVSRTQAIVRRKGAHVTLEDLGSRNGTRVAGSTLRGGSRRLSAGEAFDVGPLHVVVATTWRPAERRKDDDEPRGVVCAEPAMQKVFGLARRLAQTSTTVLVLGETGAGKEVVAEQLHIHSPRAARPYVRLHCAALPETLLESELFGHEKGAFTGALTRKVGYVEAANGGTLLIDEVGELPPATQVKLLRVLETRSVTRVGGTVEIPVDIRVVCATNRDLLAEIAAGRFREDLYYRISAFTLRVPPLRERPSEIALLAEHFLREVAARLGVPAPLLDAAAEDALLRHAWPGNVRELRNAVEHAMVLALGTGQVLPAAWASRAARSSTGWRSWG